MTATISRRLVSLADAADALAVSTRTVRRYIADGQLEAVRLGRKTLRIKDFADTEFFANQLFVGGAMQPQARWPNNPGSNLLKPGLAGGYVKPIEGDQYKVEAVNAGIPALPEGWAGTPMEGRHAALAWADARS